MRFLLPVYFIPIVEVTPHSHTSPATIDKGRITLTNHDATFTTHVVKEFLRFINKESFSRTNASPRKLMMQEARMMQLSNKLVNHFVFVFISSPATAGRPFSDDGKRSHDVVARGSHDTRLNHGHF